MMDDEALRAQTYHPQAPPPLIHLAALTSLRSSPPSSTMFSSMFSSMLALMFYYVFSSMFSPRVLLHVLFFASSLLYVSASVQHNLDRLEAPPEPQGW